LLTHRIPRVSNIFHTSILVVAIKVGILVTQPPERKRENLASNLLLFVNPIDVRVEDPQ
jgi:hypothetical protein